MPTICFKFLVFVKTCPIYSDLLCKDKKILLYLQSVNVS